MKNKKLAYFLLPVVTLVWGIVVFKIIKAVETPAYTNLHAEQMKEKSISTVSPLDTFQLILQYRDPFLSGRRSSKASINAVRSISTVQRPAFLPVSSPQPVADPIQWPQISYQGYIENRKTNTKVAMLNIGGHDQLLDEGKSAFGVKVVKVFPDSIKLHFEKEVMFFKRE